MIKHYIKIARPDHWLKNLFMLPGIILAAASVGVDDIQALLPKIILGVICVCLSASANYVINEWLDAEFDQYHPVKKNRPSVTQNLKAKWIYTEYALLIVVSIVLASFISQYYLYTIIFFLIMGFMYNVRPFRTKDRVYMDVISESINNPIRFCLGWFIISSTFPPSSILVSYWMGGAFLMGCKRFAEYRFIGDATVAGRYRESFKCYTEENLLISTVFYALLSVFFLGAFLVKHKIELLLSFPLFAILFAWYLSMSHEEDSVVQRPESLYKRTPFLWFLLLLSTVTCSLLYFDIPNMEWFLK